MILQTFYPHDLQEGIFPSFIFVQFCNFWLDLITCYHEESLIILVKMCFHLIQLWNKDITNYLST